MGLVLSMRSHRNGKPQIKKQKNYRILIWIWNENRLKTEYYERFQVIHGCDSNQIEVLFNDSLLHSYDLEFIIFIVLVIE